MSIAYLDSSALVKLMVREDETAALEADLAGRDGLVTSSLAMVECRRAAARAGNRRVLQRVSDVLEAVYLLDLTTPVLEQAAGLRPHRCVRSMRSTLRRRSRSATTISRLLPTTSGWPKPLVRTVSASRSQEHGLHGLDGRHGHGSDGLRGLARRSREGRLKNREIRVVCGPCHPSVP